MYTLMRLQFRGIQIVGKVLKSLSLKRLRTITWITMGHTLNSPHSTGCWSEAVPWDTIRHVNYGDRLGKSSLPLRLGASWQGKPGIFGHDREIWDHRRKKI